MSSDRERSEINHERAWGTRWALLDDGRVAHYWLGNDGTACGRDFKWSIYQAYADDKRCLECLALSSTNDGPEESA